MTGRMVKVTCLITRRSVHGDELVVFDHPLAGTQIPAGTADPGESPLLAALREGWEETGIPHLEVKADLASVVEATPGCGYGRLVADVAVDNNRYSRGSVAAVIDARGDDLLVQVGDERRWIPLDAFSDDCVRHIVQLESAAATAQEWWVVTPDGGGLCWRCRWLPLEGDIGLVDGHAAWLAQVRGRLRASTPARHFELPDHRFSNATSHVQFWAFPPAQSRYLVSWLPTNTRIDNTMVRRALVVARTPDQQIVLVSGDGKTMWNFPGGGREPGEAIEDTARREVREEACATVKHLCLIGYQHLLHLDDRNNVVDEELQARYAADIDLDAWEPAFEIAARRLVSFVQLRPILRAWWQPDMLDRILDATSRSWDASGTVAP